MTADLTPDQQLVLTLLAEGKTLTAAAETAGIHRNTILNWRRAVPAFAAELDRATREQALAWQEEAANAVPLAFQAILAVLNDPAASASLRLRAAGMILKMADLKSDSSASPRLRVKALDVPAPAKLEIPAQSCTITPIRKAPEPGRNSICPCGSGQKYKRCCAFSSAA
jgi:hypothetical protein